jgi:hypothetical protein
VCQMNLGNKFRGKTLVFVSQTTRFLKLEGININSMNFKTYTDKSVRFRVFFYT